MRSLLLLPLSAALAALVVVAGLGMLPARAGEDPVLPVLVRPPFLQTATPTSMLVKWRTDISTDTRLSYGLAPDALDTTILMHTEAPTIKHLVEIDSLEPGTRYYYGVGTSTGFLAGGNGDTEHYFETSPAPGSRGPVRIWVVGDSGQCSSPSTPDCVSVGKVRDEYLSYAQATGGIANLWLMLGDNAYSTGTYDQHNVAIFGVFPNILRNTPLWPVPGNHEYGTGGAIYYFGAFELPQQAEAGGMPSGTEKYYSFDYGNVHFIALDSQSVYRGLDGAMYQWLEGDLQATAAEWLIAYWHHPPYSKGSHNSDAAYEVEMREMRENFVPLLERYGVDLQLTGHSHNYERSMLIDGHYETSDTFDPELHALDTGDGDPEGDGAYQKEVDGLEPNMGAVYSVVGSSSKNTGGLGDHPIMLTKINYEGSMLIDIEGDALEAVFIDMDGLVADRFVIEKVPEPSAAAVQLAALSTLALLRVRRTRRGR